MHACDIGEVFGWFGEGAGQVVVDQLLDGYRRGAELLGFCRARLDAVELQVRMLDDGQL